MEENFDALEVIASTKGKVDMDNTPTGENIFLLWGLLSSLFFLLQFVLLRFTQKKALRLIPVYIFIAIAVTALLARVGIIIGNDGGIINGRAIVAGVLLIFLVFWIAGAALTCLLWALIQRGKNV